MLDMVVEEFQDRLCKIIVSWPSLQGILYTVKTPTVFFLLQALNLARVETIDV